MGSMNFLVLFTGAKWEQYFTICSLWENLADETLAIPFLIFSENIVRHFIQKLGDNLYGISNLISGGKILIFQNVVC